MIHSDSETLAATPKAVKAIADTLSGGRLLNIQSFTRSGTYTPTPGTQKIRVKCWGAGGGGAGMSKQNRDSVSGAAGAYAEALLDATLFSSVSVEVGTGGAASADSVSQDGGDGGGSYFGAHVTCEGGSGGIAGQGLAKGGEPAGGNVMMVFGQSGQGGTYASGFLINGVGGASFGGYNALPHVSKRVDDGSFPGGGGAMGSYVDENTHYASGKGGDGLIIVEEYS
ncbi:glycine-rich domain-containing protein [Candidatus Sodalis sp. SoCistrobi]|uniref:glycine-rich domain-containing protein n=1 Tax=Candidatus Sodalis sp. SoCistrobi TaxID=1922216 RepID=UPI0020B7C4C5|nr:tail fiber protein [Candidatus Sodalis sp. SoCistrobi]